MKTVFGFQPIHSELNFIFAIKRQRRRAAWCFSHYFSSYEHPTINFFHNSESNNEVIHNIFSSSRCLFVWYYYLLSFFFSKFRAGLANWMDMNSVFGCKQQRPFKFSFKVIQRRIKAKWITFISDLVIQISMSGGFSLGQLIFKNVKIEPFYFFSLFRDWAAEPLNVLVVNGNVEMGLGLFFPPSEINFWGIQHSVVKASIVLIIKPKHWLHRTRLIGNY